VRQGRQGKPGFFSRVIVLIVTLSFTVGLTLFITRVQSTPPLLPDAETLAVSAVEGLAPYFKKSRQAREVLSIATADRTLSRDFPAHVAILVTDHLDVHVWPGEEATLFLRLRNRTPNGAPQTLLIAKELYIEGQTWYKVWLPVRPNASTGWIRAGDVLVQGVDYSLDVHLKDRRLDLLRHGDVVASFPIAVGKAGTPTPGGVFYIQELLKPPSSNSRYGSFAFILNGYSDVVTDFAGGDGIVGIHGTNTPWLLGEGVSLGSVRLRNEAIEFLAAKLPLGTPVRVLA